MSNVFLNFLKRVAWVARGLKPKTWVFEYLIVQPVKSPGNWLNHLGSISWWVFLHTLSLFLGQDFTFHGQSLEP